MKIKPEVREKTLEHGVSFPSDEELVMLILGSGTKALPIELLAKKIIRTLDASNEEDRIKNLKALKGVGAGKALAIAAALELGRRRSCHLKAVVRNPRGIIPYVQNYAVSQKEHFLIVTLNGGHQIIQIHVVSVGTLNMSVVHPREVFVEAIRENAASIILCHNHPSGDCTPSEKDIKTTQVLLEASLIVGIEILDHIIVDCDSYFSFMEHGLLFETES